MFDEDDVPKPAPRLVPLNLDRLGVEELQAYIGQLHGEVARTEAEILRKRSIRAAADGVFKLG